MLSYLYLFSVFFLGGCTLSSQGTALHKHSEAQALMGTTIRIDVCTEDENNLRLAEAFQRVWQRLGDVSWRMNVFDEKSDVAKINSSYPHAVEVGADTYEVINKAIEYHRFTHGAFDITVWPLIALWKKGQQNNVVPDHSEILKTKKLLGPWWIQLLPHNQIRLLNETVKVDLGGIAAGYGVDEAVRILREYGFKDFLIDAGGDLFAGGHNCQGRSWRIGIRDPQDNSKLVDVISVVDRAVTTSGDYEKFYEINGQKWSHIFNPITGYPQTGVKSSTVIAPTTLEADVLATALCVLGGFKDQTLIDALGHGYAALIIESPDGKKLKIFKSQHYQDYRDEPDRHSSRRWRDSCTISLRAPPWRGVTSESFTCLVPPTAESTRQWRVDVTKIKSTGLRTNCTISSFQNTEIE